MSVGGGILTNCNIKRSAISVATGGQFLNNTLNLTYKSTLNITTGGSGTLIQGNSNITQIWLNASPLTGVTIDGNTFIGSSFTDMFMGNIASPTGGVMINNTFTLSDWDGFALNMPQADNLVFATNTIRFTTETPTSNPGTIVSITGKEVYFGGNYIDVPFEPMGGMVSLAPEAGSTDAHFTFTHNTLRMGGSTDAYILNENANGSLFSGTMYVTSTYNIFYKQYVLSGNNPFALGAQTLNSTNGANIVEYHNHNGFPGYNLSYAYTQFVGGVFSNGSPGANDTAVDPVLRIRNASSADDLQLAPWSPYYNDNGSGLNIGADTNTRGSTFHFNSAGTIDYSAVDATTTVGIVTSTVLRGGDTLIFAAGTYAFPTLTSSTPLTTGLTITGAGSGIGGGSTTLFTQCSSGDSTGMSISGIDNVSISGVDFYETCANTSGAFKLANSSGSTLSNVRVRPLLSSDPTNGLLLDTVSNSTLSTISASGFVTPSVTSNYLLYNTSFSWGGNDYTDSAATGAPANASFHYVGPGCDIGNITTYADVGASPSTVWNLALAHVGLARITIWVPNDLISAPSGLESDCGGFGVGVDEWIPSVFTYSGGTFTYNASAVSGAGAAIVAGYTDPARIARTSTFKGGGVKFLNSSTNTVSTVTSSGNTCGVIFTGSSANNVLTSYTVSSSGEKDICANASSGVNTLRQSAVDATSATVQGDGTVKLQYKARGYVSASSVPVSGISVTIHDTGSTSSTTMTTGGDGYTAYSGFFDAITLSSSAVGNTAGGYNPFTATAAAGLGYGQASTSGNLTTPNQTFSIAVTAAASDSSSDTSFGLVNAPSITKLMINGGASSTQATNLSIKLDAVNAAQMLISTSNLFTGAAWQEYKNIFSFLVDAAPGVKKIFVKVSNSGGTESEVSQAQITYVPSNETATSTVVAPSIPNILAPKNDAIVPSHTEFSGTADTKATLELHLFYNNTEIFHKVTPVSDAGAWTCGVHDVLLDGDYILQAVSKNSGGATSESCVVFSVKNEQQIAPLVVTSPTTDSTISTDKFTTSGTAQPNTKIVVVRDQVQTYVGSVDSHGKWSLTIVVPHVSAAYSFVYKAVNAEGQTVGHESRIYTVEIPAAPPAKEPTTPPQKPQKETSNIDYSGGVGEQKSVIAVGSTTTEVSEISSSTEIGVVTSTPIVLETESDVALKSESAVTNTVAAALLRDVPKEIRKQAKAVIIAAQKPEVQITNKAVVIPVTAAVAVGAVSSTLGYAQYALYLRFIFTQPLLLFTRRRRKGWGVAYNTFTNMPIDLALVRLVDSKTERVVQSQVTDTEGRYHFFAKPGDYRIEVNKPDYIFPSVAAQGVASQDPLVYLGSSLGLRELTHMTYHLPLDPAGETKTVEQIIKTERRKRFVGALAIGGIVLSAVSFILSPSIFAGVFLCVHAIGYFGFRRLAMPHDLRNAARVTNGATGTPLNYAIVRIFNAEYNKLLETSVTGADGKYAFIVGPGTYTISVEKPGFTSAVIGPVTVGRGSDLSSLLKDVQLSPVGTGQALTA